ncbi:J domain-containing protein [Phanerochaete sordida]|uniref:J domain-containing protein n=1 Tax=Phanerochaete sordida TaxID=48140 RepID=A0A9P3FZE0_9APHY|nr:J domain-containing protein [Phanerochaete sordida]
MNRISQQVRFASTSTHPYPWPAHTRPTPWQIFHLPPGASQKDIKSRYYELVRVHHPDSPRGRDVPSAVRHARFQSLTTAYDTLRGKRIPHATAGNPRGWDPAMDELLRRRRYQHMHQNAWHDPWDQGFGAAQHDWHASSVDDEWKDKVIICVGLFSVVLSLAPVMIWGPLGGHRDTMHMTAAANLAQARREAREFGEERRREIRRRVQEYREKCDMMNEKHTRRRGEDLDS